MAWGALAVAGQAAVLSAVRAGTGVGYQHLPPLAELPAAMPRWALAVLAMQTLAVAAAAWSARAGLARARRALGGARGVALVAAVVLVRAAPSREPGIYAGELALAAALTLLQFGTVVGFARAFAGGWSLSPVATRLLAPPAATPTPGGTERWVIALAAAAVAFGALLALLVYESHPHVPDEVAYLLQARTFAAGALTLPAPPVPEAFETYLMWNRDGRWFSPFPPAWPALLALGVWTGLAWLVNPLLHGLNVLLVFGLLRELYALPTARLATLLFAFAPWNLFLAMSFMSHPAALTTALLGAVAVARLRRTPAALGWAATGGACAGALVLFRPLEAAIVGPLLVLWALGARGRRWRFAPAAVVGLAAAAAGAATLPYNSSLMGEARSFPVMAYMDATFGAGSNALGFGPDRGAGWSGVDPFPGHGPLDAALNAVLNLFAVDTDLFGWSTGSLLALWSLLALGRLGKADRWMLAAAAAVVALHSLYWFSGGPDFGARYWYLAVVPCVALSARGLETLAARGATGDPRAATRVLAAAGLLSLASLTTFVPWRSVDKYRNYRGMRPELRQLAARLPWHDALVLVRGERHPDFASAVVYNPLDPAAAGALFAWDRGGVRERLTQAFPRRRYWLVDGPSVSGDGYRVVAGPLGAEELLALPDAAPPLPR